MIDILTWVVVCIIWLVALRLQKKKADDALREKCNELVCAQHELGVAQHQLEQARLEIRQLNWRLNISAADSAIAQNPQVRVDNLVVPGMLSETMRAVLQRAAERYRPLLNPYSVGSSSDPEPPVLLPPPKRDGRRKIKI